MTATELAVILEGHGMRVRPRASGFQAECPAHDDRKRKRALSVSLGRDGRQLIWCHNCGDRTFDAVRGALGLPAEAFFGWRPYNHKRSRGLSPGSSVTLSISGVSVLNAKALLKRDQPGSIDPIALPPRAGRVARAVAADMALLFALASAAGAGDVPLMYSARWAARPLGLDTSSVARALRSLVRHGSIVRAKSVPSWNGRSTRTYRRAGR
jgi:hypothetical protein